MLNNLPVRQVGHLFDDVLWVTLNGSPVQGRLVADSLEEAKIVLDDETILDSGRLQFERSSDAGNPTRVLYFIGSDQKIAVDETRLKTA